MVKFTWIINSFKLFGKKNRKAKSKKKKKKKKFV